VLDAMGEVEKANAERWEKVFQTLDRFTDQMKEFETVQQQLLGQSVLAAQAGDERDLLFRKVEETWKVVAQLRLEAMGKDLEVSPGDSDGRESSCVRRRRPPHDAGRRQPRGPSPPGSVDGRQRGSGSGERSNHPLPKLNFPTFLGEDPVIWLDKCLDYFMFFQST
jgi:hypothetical protein